MTAPSPPSSRPRPLFPPLSPFARGTKRKGEGEVSDDLRRRGVETGKGTISGKKGPDLGRKGRRYCNNNLPSTSLPAPTGINGPVVKKSRRNANPSWPSRRPSRRHRRCTCSATTTPTFTNNELVNESFFGMRNRANSYSSPSFAQTRTRTRTTRKNILQQSGFTILFLVCRISLKIATKAGKNYSKFSPSPQSFLQSSPGRFNTLSCGRRRGEKVCKREMTEMTTRSCESANPPPRAR